MEAYCYNKHPFNSKLGSVPEVAIDRGAPPSAMGVGPVERQIVDARRCRKLFLHGWLAFYCVMVYALISRYIVCRYPESRGFFYKT